MLVTPFPIIPLIPFAGLLPILLFFVMFPQKLVPVLAFMFTPLMYPVISIVMFLSVGASITVMFLSDKSSGCKQRDSQHKCSYGSKHIPHFS